MSGNMYVASAILKLTKKKLVLDQILSGSVLIAHIMCLKNQIADSNLITLQSLTVYNTLIKIYIQ